MELLQVEVVPQSLFEFISEAADLEFPQFVGKCLARNGQVAVNLLLRDLPSKAGIIENVAGGKIAALITFLNNYSI